MSLSLAKEDRKFAIAVAAIFITVAGLVIFLVQTDSGPDAFPSSYSGGSSGAKAAFMLLQNTGYNVRRFTESPRTLAGSAADTTLVLADPLPADAEDIQAVQQFVEKGGRVVGTGPGMAIFVKGNHLARGMPHFDWKSYGVQEPSDLTRGIDEIQLAPQIYFRSDGEDEAPFKNGDEIPVARFHYGKGEVVWWSTAQPLTNAGISRADNFQLLLNSVGAPAGRRILWDEYFHQGGETLVDSLINSPLRWGLIESAFIAMLVCFSWSRRFGPTRMAALPSRLMPMEFVETLAELYKNSGAGSVALEVVYRRFRSRAQQRLSIHRDYDIQTTAGMIARRSPNTDAATVTKLLQEIEGSMGEVLLSPKRTTELIQQLHSLNVELGLITEEKSWKR
jgi:hypothetical protein